MCVARRGRGARLPRFLELGAAGGGRSVLLLGRRVHARKLPERLLELREHRRGLRYARL
jgi:hypothetical protein